MYKKIRGGLCIVPRVFFIVLSFCFYLTVTLQTAFFPFGQVAVIVVVPFLRASTNIPGSVY